MSTTEPRVTGVEDAAEVGPANAPETKADPAAVAALIPRLREICGAEQVITGREQLRTYESDGLLQYQRPGAVVLRAPRAGPRRRASLRSCRGPWVARGSGSGLCGGALPVEHGSDRAVAAERFSRSTSPNQRVVVEPGVTNTEVSLAVGPRTSTRPTRRARSSAPSAATSRRTPAARTASSTASRPTTSRPGGRPLRRRGRPDRRQASSTRRATTCSAPSSAPRARSRSSRGSGCGSSPSRSPSGRWPPSSTTRARRARRCRRSSRPVSSRARSR